MIKTKHLLIKKIITDDGQVAALLADPLLLKRAHLTFSTQPVSSLEVNLLLRSVHFYGIYQQNKPGRLIGLLYLDQASPELPGQLEIGYLLQQESWGQGIMTEAVAGLVDKLSQPVVAVTDKNNCGSQHVLEKSGFTLVREEETGLVWQKHGLQS